MSVMAIVGSAQAYSGGNGGRVYAFNNISNLANVNCAPARPSRRSITFANPSTSNIVYVSMIDVIDVVTGVASPLIPTTALLGGTFPIYPGAVVTFGGECQHAWQALATTGVSNPLTVMDSFI